ncbi:MAG: efflux RND transporter periplasmic adaptor subunit [Nitrospirota bacterium]
MTRLAAVLAMLCLASGCNKNDTGLVQGYVEGEFVYIASPLAGSVEALHVRRGTQAKAGDPLFALESGRERAARDEALAALTLSEKEYARQRQLFQSNLTAQEAVDRARALRDQDRERLAQAEWALAQKRQAAPAAGLVFDVLYREGEWVPAGRPVVSLLPPQNIHVRAFVPEPMLGALHPGEAATVFVDGRPEPVIGTIRFISPRAEYTPPVIYSQESRDKLVFMVEVGFDPGTAARLNPGQPVDVRFGA